MGKIKIEKEIEKAIMADLRKVSKKQNLKIISNCIYKVVNDYFSHAVYWIQYDKDQWTLFLRMNIKANNYDNLFWEIFEMPENINAKESLRANGAYVCPSFQWDEKSYEINVLESMQLDIENAINDFQDEIDKLEKLIKIEYGDFNTFILSQEDILDEKLMKMIANISKEDYFIAKEIARTEIENGQRGGYRNKGKDIYEYIVEYCNKQLNNC